MPSHTSRLCRSSPRSRRLKRECKTLMLFSSMADNTGCSCAARDGNAFVGFARSVLLDLRLDWLDVDAQPRAPIAPVTEGQASPPPTTPQLSHPPRLPRHDTTPMEGATAIASMSGGATLAPTDGRRFGTLVEATSSGPRGQPGSEPLSPSEQVVVGTTRAIPSNDYWQLRAAVEAAVSAGLVK